MKCLAHLGLVVQSIVSLTLSLVEDSLSLTVLTKAIVIILVAENFGSFRSAYAPHIFSAKMAVF